MLTPNQSTFSTRHALVISSGMAELLAARILADHFEQVTIIERDRGYPHPQSLELVCPRAAMYMGCCVDSRFLGNCSLGSLRNSRLPGRSELTGLRI